PGGEVTPARHVRPVTDLVAALDPPPGRRGGLDGKVSEPHRDAQSLTRTELERGERRLAVEAERGGGGAGDPVQRHVGQHLVQSEPRLEISVALAPAPALLPHPPSPPRPHIPQ